MIDSELAERLQAATTIVSSAIHDAVPGRIDRIDDQMATHLTALRDAANKAGRDRYRAADPKPPPRGWSRRRPHRDRRHRGANPGLVHPTIPERTDVVWLEHEENPGATRAAQGGAAVGGGLLRERLFARSTVVLTSPR
ncbi:ATP-dependent helicase DinG domain protein [Mycobacterium xenopi 4042]|uniref:ATP-dependent helicase DinG domain protein n=1 Tax=Mycobacterium xenopi 4042 TaxID=1299334 RepID=X8CIZ4_MYCXE|nr:ATP-dependent helicase DinG domain protein [Mycobacterium xenopi 4042]